MISLLQFIETAQGDEELSGEEELSEEDDSEHSQTANTDNVSRDVESFQKLTLDDTLDEGIESTSASPSQSLPVLSEENTTTKLVRALNQSCLLLHVNLLTS